jgi:hypothetical protein
VVKNRRDLPLKLKNPPIAPKEEEKEFHPDPDSSGGIITAEAERRRENCFLFLCSY